MNYKVGQIFYLVGAETAKVIPFRVVEEVVRTTLEGIEKSFIAELPDESATKIELEKLKGEIFDSTVVLKRHMLENAENAIDSMIKNAAAMASASFDAIEVDSEVAHKTDMILSDKTTVESKKNTGSSPDNMVKVDIGNGVVANMKVSDLEKVNQA